MGMATPEAAKEWRQHRLQTCCTARAEVSRCGGCAFRKTRALRVTWSALHP